MCIRNTNSQQPDSSGPKLAKKTCTNTCQPITSKSNKIIRSSSNNPEEFNNIINQTAKAGHDYMYKQITIYKRADTKNYIFKTASRKLSQDNFSQSDTQAFLKAQNTVRKQNLG